METIKIKSINGDVLFEYKKENNTIKDTIEEAVKQGISLFGADLRTADLSDANLYGADLRGANISKKNLLYANLCGVKLS